MNGNVARLDDEDIAVRIAASLRMASQLHAMGALSHQAVELLRRSASDFLAESYRCDTGGRPLSPGRSDG